MLWIDSRNSSKDVQMLGAELPWLLQYFNKKRACLFFPTLYLILSSLSDMGCRNRAVKMTSVRNQQLISSLLEDLGNSRPAWSFKNFFRELQTCLVLLEDFKELQTCLVLLEDFREFQTCLVLHLLFQSNLLEKRMQFGGLSSIVGLQNGHFCIIRSLPIQLFATHT